ncbi:MAG: dicarboxylate/amino acid:cation symporter [Elusimicrobia bacterium]|nr:dicarboxylate/amino acid:cation symporter [Elusimicrobiota bacterium]
MIHKIKKFTNTNTLVIVGIILGVIFGLMMPELAIKQKVIGQIFIALLKMLVVLLVFASIFIAISGLGSLKQLKKIGLKTVALYLIPTALATALAIIVMNLVKIGHPVSS